jgi:hypothetical protein
MQKYRAIEKQLFANKICFSRIKSASQKLKRQRNRKSAKNIGSRKATFHK